MLTAKANPSFDEVRYQYHPGTDAATAFVDVPQGDVTLPGTSTTVTWPQTRTGAADFSGLVWDVHATLARSGIGDGPVSVRACFSTSGGALTCSPPVTVMLDYTAFGSSYANEDFGPGTVALLTGDYSLDATDVSVGGLSIGRTATSLAPPAASSGADGVFGPGWTASLPGPDAGAADYQLEDHTAQSYVTLVGANGETLTYTKGSDGKYRGVGVAADGSVITKDSSTQFTLFDPDGVKTVWSYANSAWGVSSVIEAGQEGTTSYSRDGNGRVTRIVAPVPAGVSCTNPTTTKGCRSLGLTYAATTTATGTTPADWGSYTGRVDTISYTAWNPATSAMTTTNVTNYSYDSTGRLRAVWDPRISPALKDLRVIR